MKKGLRKIFIELSRKYEFSEKVIKKWYYYLKQYPVFDDDNGFYCLEILCQKRLSSSIDEEYPYTDAQSFNLCADYSLYYVYGEEAKPYLSKEFIELLEGKYDIEEDQIEYDEFDYDIMERDEYLENLNKKKVLIENDGHYRFVRIHK